MPNDGCWNFTEENNEVLVVEFDYKGHALGDSPGVCSKDVKIGLVFLLALYKNNKERPRYKF
ncbi:40S ribosomal protein S23 [Lemmus lemmus]